ncbi:MscL family protein [Mycoplasmopsis caviae]|uniref:Large conductance mechanosensitive channel protein n=1 Tax=Mycoplasmopsis caviae TaxID=55603 RepID=A0A3P8LIH6_9BACT|nr:MscL family protein [Mycoplasmopsis caviae]UUD34921.1 MscL family protein [Mycoplasmopsis caviae]VDR42252.1 large conductance mechanosensitive channel protein [Mycoplasmopsis caviae]
MFKKSCNDAWTVVKRGNMFMLAIGLLLGTAFNAVVSSLANDVIMQAIAKLFNVDEVKELKVGNILIGKFLAALISFIIVAFIIFVALIVIYLIRNVIEAKKLKKNPPAVIEPKPTTEELILNELKKLNERLENLEQNRK